MSARSREKWCSAVPRTAAPLLVGGQLECGTGIESRIVQLLQLQRHSRSRGRAIPFGGFYSAKPAQCLFPAHHRRTALVACGLKSTGASRALAIPAAAAMQSVRELHQESRDEVESEVKERSRGSPFIDYALFASSRLEWRPGGNPR
uniref:Uncharacterized protein n=1 Tax=Anopheles albimanus TaxID=7167 RepID=A0A182F177_ANOAL